MNKASSLCVQELQLNAGQGEGLHPKAEDTDAFNLNRRKGPFRSVDQLQVSQVCLVFPSLSVLMSEWLYVG